eukprot:COSAG06_NODE_16448_length_1001_cov_0.708426_1_plen_121_part_00
MARAKKQADTLEQSTPPPRGRNGIFVEFEGWLEKKSSAKIAGRARWQKRWFAIMTKERDGLVDSRSLQYFSNEPSLDQVCQWLRAALSPLACSLTRALFRNRSMRSHYHWLAAFSCISFV